MVFSPPSLDELLGFSQRGEPVRIQAFRSQRSVERFHLRVVGRLPRPRKIDLHTGMVGP